MVNFVVSGLLSQKWLRTRTSGIVPAWFHRVVFRQVEHIPYPCRHDVRVHFFTSIRALPDVVTACWPGAIIVAVPLSTSTFPVTRVVATFPLGAEAFTLNVVPNTLTVVPATSTMKRREVSGVTQISLLSGGFFALSPWIERDRSVYFRNWVSRWSYQKDGRCIPVFGDDDGVINFVNFNRLFFATACSRFVVFLRVKAALLFKSQHGRLRVIQRDFISVFQHKLYGGNRLRDDYFFITVV